MKKLLYLLILLAFTSCTINESNVPGPVGPPGPPGNVNVISTEPIILNTWVYNPQYNWYASDINVPEITADVVNTGLPTDHFRPKPRLDPATRYLWQYYHQL